MSKKADCRRAPDTPGLLKIITKWGWYWAYEICGKYRDGSLITERSCGTDEIKRKKQDCQTCDDIEKIKEE